MQGARQSDGDIEESLPGCRVGGGRETRPVATAGIGRQRELRDQEQAACNIPDRAIHLARLVGKDAQGKDLIEQFSRGGLGIAFFGAHEDKKPLADRANRIAGHDDARFGHAL